MKALSDVGRPVTRRLRERLPHLRELGVTALWLMPVQPVGLQKRSGSLGDPYAVRDFLAVDPALAPTRLSTSSCVARAGHRTAPQVLLICPPPTAQLSGFAELFAEAGETGCSPPPTGSKV